MPGLCHQDLKKQKRGYSIYYYLFSNWKLQCLSSKPLVFYGFINKLLLGTQVSSSLIIPSVPGRMYQMSVLAPTIW